VASDKRQVTSENKIADENPVTTIAQPVENPIADSFPSPEKSFLIPVALPKDSGFPSIGIDPTKDVAARKADSTIYPKNIFSVEAGSNFILGWKYGTATEAQGLNPVGGFAFTHKFNAKWALALGVRYERVGNLKYSFNQITDSLPGFGLNNSSTIITPLSLHYISVPLKLERTFNAKNTFGIGASFSYLFNTTSRVAMWNETDAGTQQMPGAKNQYGYFNGLNRVDAALTICYRRQFFTKFGLQVEGTYGLIDVKNNSYFTNSSDRAEHIMGMRLMLTYNLF